MKNPVKQKISFSTFLMSILCAFFLDIKPVNLALVNSGLWGNEAGLLNTFFPVTIGIIIIWGFNKYGISTFKKNINGWLLIAFLLFYQMFSTRFVGQPHTAFPLFLGFTVAGLMIPLLSSVDVCTMLKAVMLFPIFSVFRLGQVFAIELDSIDMDLSYGFVIPITACIIYYVSFFKKEKGFNKYISILAFAVNAVFLWYLLLFGSRGPIFGLLCLMAFLLVIKYNKNGGVRVNKSKWAMTLFIGLIVVFFFGPLMSAFSGILSDFGINMHFVDKMIELQAGGNLSNGRDKLAPLAIQGFWNSPVWGNGFDRFHANTGMLYPHNFILQILYDGGLLLFIILIIPAIKEVKFKYRHCSMAEYALTTFLLFASVPGALFSQNLWMIGPLWFFAGYLKSNSYINRQIIR